MDAVYSMKSYFIIVGACAGWVRSMSVLKTYCMCPPVHDFGEQCKACSQIVLLAAEGFGDIESYLYVQARTIVLFIRHR